MDDAGLAQGSRAVLPARTASTTSRMESVTSCGLSWWIRWPLSVFVTCFDAGHERSEIRVSNLLGTVDDVADVGRRVGSK